MPYEQWTRSNARQVLDTVADAILAMDRDGPAFPLHLSISSIETERGEEFAAVVSDLTAVHEKQAALHARRELLARAGRLSTLGEMTASIAHEINQPLTAIAMYAQICERLLEQEQVDAVTLLDVLRKLSDQALRAGAVSERVQHFVSHDTGSRGVQNLNELLRDIEPLAAGDARACGIDLEFVLDPNLPLVNCSAINIQQVTLNLLRNAFDAMAEIDCRHGSCVTVITECAEGGGDPAKCGTLKVSVLDHGPGIAAPLKQALFNPFHGGKKTGVGLGLSTCQTMVSEEGGVLDYDDRKPHGCRFWYTLPSVPDSVLGA